MTRRKTSRKTPDQYEVMSKIGKPLPKMVPRGRLGLNTVLFGNESLNGTTSSAGGIVIGSRLLIPGYTGDLTTASVSNIARYYATAKYTPGTTFHYVPQVSLSTSGAIYIAYTDNVEVINAFARAATPNDSLSIVRSISNVRNYPVWQTFSLPMGNTLRRKMFDVNGDYSTSGSDEVNYNALDRCCQGAFLYAIEGVPGSSVICRPWVHTKLVLEGLKAGAT